MGRLPPLQEAGPDKSTGAERWEAEVHERLLVAAARS